MRFSLGAPTAKYPLGVPPATFVLGAPTAAYPLGVPPATFPLGASLVAASTGALFGSGAAQAPQFESPPGLAEKE